ncbi:MAG: aminopeptidase [Acidobacteria bacterium]|nr:aminopeptidase [Candidatus Sulfomarinibacter sp. MAG AM1]
MADLERMILSARRAMVEVLELKPSDRVLVVQDPQCQKCSQAFFDAARAEGCTTTAYVLPDHGRPLKAMPEGMAATVEGQDVVINVMSGSSDEVPFRIEWLTLLEELDLRVGHSPNIHEDMMDGGPMDVDYGLMVDRAERLIVALDEAVSVQITTPGGTDLTLDLQGRRFVTDVKITETEKGCNLPCGEVYCAPVEDGADGVVVADGSIGGEGPPPSPVTLEVQAGRVTTVRCADPQWQERITQLLDTDTGARTIAELGIGLNPKARLVGIMLEDEKAYRTAHIAFGSNIGMPGGVNESTTHIDYLVHRPTIVARSEDATDRIIVEDGDLCV